MPITFPESLKKAAANNKVIPVVGAGVSLAIEDLDGNRVFPSWRELLLKAADALNKEGKEKYASAIMALTDLENYSEAAHYAREGLEGALWSNFFKNIFDLEKKGINQQSLKLPEKIWEIHNRIITFNYDRVLHWASKDSANLIEIDNDNTLAIKDFRNNTINKPQVWHFHGRIQNPASIVFTPESYTGTYLGSSEKSNAAISIFKEICRDYNLLFIGCSLDDALVIKTLHEQYALFETDIGPHYIACKDSDEQYISKNVSGLPFNFLRFSSYGEPLIKLVEQVGVFARTKRDLYKHVEGKNRDRISSTNFLNPGGQLDVVIMKTLAFSWNEKEILKVAKRKYIKALYVSRNIELEIKSLFVNDDILNLRLNEIADIPYQLIKDTKKQIKKLDKLDEQKKIKLSENIKASEQRKKLENKLRLANKIDNKLKDSLSAVSPCASVNRTIFRDLCAHTNSYRSDSSYSDRKSIDKMLSVYTLASQFITVIVDRAGGGKTNLLCNLVNLNNKIEPSIFFGGRLNVSSEDSIVQLLATSLGNRSIKKSYEYIWAINEELERQRCHLAVFIDGINENRNIAELNKALNKVEDSLVNSRFRFIITCRDIYWTFFKGEKWAKHANIVQGNLYSFSKLEQDKALDAYLKYFNIIVDLESQAREKCKHPLLLRFFCEAYGNPGGAKVNLGCISEIKLKPLFDDYWNAKIIKRFSTGNISSNIVENIIYKMIQYMFQYDVASISTSIIPNVTGIDDMDSNNSIYLGLLDEDIIIEETPTSKSDIRNVIFVYEEFMEYVAARYLCIQQKEWSIEDMEKYFTDLDNKIDQFVNYLGIAEYLCAFHLEEGRNDLAFCLLVSMARKGKVWIKILSNIFSKYDLALSMFVDFSKEQFLYLSNRLDPKDKAVDLKGLFAILDTIGSNNRSLMAELVGLIIYSNLLPHVVSVKDLMSSNIPKIGTNKVEYTLVHKEKQRIKALLKVAGKVIDKYELSTTRKNFWKQWATGSEYVGLVDRVDLIKAIPPLLIGSQRREKILTLACNGLSDKDISIRKACAQVSKDLRNDYSQALRGIYKENEHDMVVISLLQDNFN